MQELFDQDNGRDRLVVARLRFLNRGASMGRPTTEWSPRRNPPFISPGFLEEMKASHLTNLEACERLAESLQAA
jgi:hypothetical protein